MVIVCKAGADSQTVVSGLRIVELPGKLLDMHTLARLLQFAGLAIPPLAMVAQLQEQISAGTMLQFLVLAIGVFVLGYTLQRHSGRSDS